MPTLVANVLRRGLEHPDHPAVIAGEQAVTYGRLRQGILAAAAHLKNLGVAPGDRVVLAASATPAFAFGYFATHLVGAVVVPLDPAAPAVRRKHIVERVDAKAVFAARRTDGAREIDELCALEAVEAEFAGPGPDDLADLLFTTGTTGRPKGVMLSHGNVLAAATNINAVLQNGAGDREVVPIPLSHSFGLGRLRCNALAGGTIIIVDGFKLPGEVLNALARDATGLAMVPAGMAVLVRFGREELQAFADRLRYIEIGSAPMPREHKELLIELLPKTRIWMHYGLTEASRSTFIEFHESRDSLDSIGKPTVNVDVRIVDDEKNEVATGGAGQIAVRGGMVARGYWEDPELTRKKLADGWIYTGDIGHRDEQGYIYLHGRKDDMMNVGGFNVAPVEVEHALDEHPAIESSACIAVPDPRGIAGDMIKAFLVLARGQERLKRRELVEWLKVRVEAYKIPTQYVWVDALPRTGSGKLQRNVLRQQ